MARLKKEEPIQASPNPRRIKEINKLGTITEEDIRLKKLEKNKGKSKPRMGHTTKEQRREIQKDFLIELKDCGIISVASRRVGIRPSQMTKWLQRYPQFAEKVDRVFEEFIDGLENVAVQRAIEKSDSLLITLLKANRPEKYHDRTRMDLQADVKGKTEGTVNIMFSQEEVGEADKRGVPSE